jgi:hypothetical protein
MVRLISFLSLLIVGLQVAGQEQYIRQGTLKASATIAPSFMLNRNVENIYLNGFIAYQLDDHFSFRGETFYYIKGAANASTDIVYNGAMNTYFGVFYHRGINNWDNYIGFQPGVSVVQTIFKPGTSVSPSFAFKIGTAYYVWKYFHFFADLTYTNTTVRGLSIGSLKSDELIISAGLGFQINTKKQ